MRLHASSHGEIVIKTERGEGQREGQRGGEKTERERFGEREGEGRERDRKRRYEVVFEILALYDRLALDGYCYCRYIIAHSDMD